MLCFISACKHRYIVISFNLRKKELVWVIVTAHIVYQVFSSVALKHVEGCVFPLETPTWLALLCPVLWPLICDLPWPFFLCLLFSHYVSHLCSFSASILSRWSYPLLQNHLHKRIPNFFSILIFPSFSRLEFHLLTDNLSLEILQTAHI